MYMQKSRFLYNYPVGNTFDIFIPHESRVGMWALDSSQTNDSWGTRVPHSFRMKGAEHGIMIHLSHERQNDTQGYIYVSPSVERVTFTNNVRFILNVRLIDERVEYGTVTILLPDAGKVWETP